MNATGHSDLTAFSRYSLAKKDLSKYSTYNAFNRGQTLARCEHFLDTADATLRTNALLAEDIDRKIVQPFKTIQLLTGGLSSSNFFANGQRPDLTAIINEEGVSTKAFIEKYYDRLEELGGGGDTMDEARKWADSQMPESDWTRHMTQDIIKQVLPNLSTSLTNFQTRAMAAGTASSS
jgi:hypothetical protein